MKFRTLAAAAALAVIGAGAVVAADEPQVVRQQMMKKVGGAMGALSGIATQTADPYALNYDGDPQKAFGFAYTNAVVGSELGPLPAWIVPGAGTPGDLWMVYAHGIAGRRESGYKALSVAQPLGITSLLFSYRNDADAPKAPQGIYGFGVSEWKDLEAAVKVARDKGARRIILAGDSMGGAIIGEFLRRSPEKAGVVALVLDSPALDIRAIVRGFAARIGFPMPAAVAWTARRILPWRVAIDFSNAVTLQEVAGVAAVFDAHGIGDSVVPISVSDALDQLRGGHMIYLRTGADHVMSWQEDPERYRAELERFLFAA